MRRNKVLSSALVAAVSAVAVCASAAHAASITRNNTVNNLNTNAAWTGGNQPGTGDIATWNSSSLAGSQSLGGSVAWGGIFISSGTPSPGVTITDPGGAVLTLGADGINLNNNANTNRGITLNPALSLSADQTWLLGQGSAASILTSSVISGTGKLTVNASSFSATPLGSLTLSSGASTFSGGLTIQPGVNLTIGSAAVAHAGSGGALTSSALGTGPLTINGGNITTNNKPIVNPSITLGGDFTFGSTSRTVFTGNIDLTGGTRTITLTRSTPAANASTGGGNDALRITPPTEIGLNNISISNGSLRFVSTAPAGSLSGVSFSGGVNSINFADNAGIIIGDRVYTSLGSSFMWGFAANSQPPSVTVESGGYLSLSENTASRNVTVASLSGAGTVLNNDNTNAGELAANLFINGGTKTTTSEFSGIIRNNDSVTFPGTVGQLSSVAVTKRGDTTQILSGANLYTGFTSVAGGVLSVSSLANGGVASNIGASTNIADNLSLNGGTLRYTGAATSTDRLFSIGATGGTLDASGTGPLVFSNTGAAVTGDPLVRNGGTTAGSTTVSITFVDDLVVGMSVAGDGIPAGTTVAAIDRTIGSFTLSQPATSTVGVNALTVGTADRVLTLAGSNGDDNTLSVALGDSAAGAKLGLSKIGDGKWVLSGTNTYTGVTAVSAGILQIDGVNIGAGDVTVASGAILGGNGSVAGAVSVATGGTLSPGASVGSFTAGSVDLDGTLAIDIVNGDPSTNDLLNVTGALDISAATVSFSIDGGLTGGAHVFASYGTLVGSEFLSITGLPEGYEIDYNYNSLNQIAVVEAVAFVEGDADGDGDVDFDDLGILLGNYDQTGFVAFTNGDSDGDGDVDFDDLGLLLGNYGFGVTPASLDAAPAVAPAVPEPSAAGILVPAAAMLMARRRRA